jgi:hypothetical protein
LTILTAAALGVALASQALPVLRAQQGGAADEKPSAPPPHAQPAPTLQRLSAETQSLYDVVRPGIVRVQLPPTHWPQAATAENPLDKWKEKLSPEVRQRIAEAQARSATTGENVGVSTEIRPVAPQPTTQPQAGGTLVAPIPRLQVSQRMDGGLELLPFSESDAPPSDAPQYDAQMPNVSLKVIGLLINDKGHVLVPLYIDRAALGEETLRVSTGDGKVSSATLVGSDRQTNLTVLKIADPVGKPVRITAGRPDDGSLVMVLSPGGDAGKLSVWTGGQQDRGIVVTMDGGVAGFARYGQFLCGANAQPVVDQLVQHGRVRRATLGVLVEETETPDFRRAMRIEKVVPDTPAEKVGLRDGDYILSMGGAPVSDLPSFAAAIAAREGQTELEILRGEKTFKVTVVLTVK